MTQGSFQLRVRPRSVVLLPLALFLVALEFWVVSSGTKRFILWPQILPFWNAELSDIARLFVDINAHSLRVALMYPVIRIARTFGIHHDIVFSYAVFLSLLVQSILLSRTCSFIRKRSAAFALDFFAPTFVFFSVLSLFQNGRLVFAFLGLSIILHQQVAWLTRQKTSAIGCVAGQAFGLWFMSVSSGTFLIGEIAFVAFTILMPMAEYPEAEKRDSHILLLGILMGLLLTPFTWVLIQKNLEFYGGGVQGLIRMFNHGPGELFWKTWQDAPYLLVPLVGISLLVAGVLALGTSILMRRRLPRSPLVNAVIACVIVGQFGYSTLVVGIPAFFVLSLLLAMDLLPRLLPKHLREAAARREPLLGDTG